MDEFPQPAWMTDGKGLRGDIPPVQIGNIAFPPAEITNPDNQNALSVGALGFPSGNSSTIVQVPFQIITQVNPLNSAQTQFGVNFNSLLYSNKNITAPPAIPNVTITGLLTSATPTPTDTGWVTWNGSNDYVWLEGSFGTWPNISAVNIYSLSAAGGHTYGGGDVENNGGSGTPVQYTQTKFRVLIGTLTAPTAPATAPIVKQILNRNLKLYPCSMDSFDSTGGNENNIATIYPFICQA